MRLLCLANSKKEGGRCIAGILLDENNKPISENNKPVWIRPVCKAKNGQVPIELCDTIVPFDIIEINDTDKIGTGYQSENTTFNEKTIVAIDRAENEILNGLHSKTDVIFGNRGKALPEDTISTLDHSLILVKSSKFKILEKQYAGKADPQIRLEFTYNDDSYDLPVTDIQFLDEYNQDKALLEGKESIDIVLSLGGVHNTWYNKLVATIIY